MKQEFIDIQKYVLEFVNSYEYKTEIEEILGTKLTQLSIFYKPDYFKENSEYYKKGIGDIIVQFDSGYKIVIKHTISDSWCFALLKTPYTVIEEVWYLSTEQEAILPNLIVALEKGFPFRNSYSNLHIKQDT